MASIAHPNVRYCSYTKVDGHRCGSPAWQTFDHCWHHHGLKERFRNQQLSFPPLDDQNSVQVAIMDILNGMLSGRLNRADAYTMLYGISVARHNLKGLTLVPPSPDVISEQIAAAVEQAKAEIRAELEAEHGKPQESLAAYLLQEFKKQEEEEKAGQASDGAEPAELADAFRSDFRHDFDGPGLESACSTQKKTTQSES
jgi:hypothetical protein